MSRRGFSLVELLVALTLTAGLSGLLADLLLRSALHLRDRSERAAEEHNLRVAAGAFRAVLESLGADSVAGPDLLAMGSSALSARAARAHGVVCEAQPGRLIARADTLWWHALRDPVAGRDSVLVGRLDRPAWQRYPLVGAPSSTVCPDGSAAIALPVLADSLALAGAGDGSPLEVFEGVELRLYTSAPDRWIGERLLATTQAIQPFAGPMTLNGLLLSFLKGDGSSALTPDDAAGVEIRLEALTERAGGVGLARGAAPRSDSLRTFVALARP